MENWLILVIICISFLAFIMLLIWLGMKKKGREANPSLHGLPKYDEKNWSGCYVKSCDD